MQMCLHCIQHDSEFSTPQLPDLDPTEHLGDMVEQDNSVMLSYQYWPKSLRNVYTTLLNLCHEILRQFWRQAGNIFPPNCAYVDNVSFGVGKTFGAQTTQYNNILPREFQKIDWRASYNRVAVVLLLTTLLSWLLWSCIYFLEEKKKKNWGSCIVDCSHCVGGGGRGRGVIRQTNHHLPEEAKHMKNKEWKVQENPGYSPRGTKLWETYEWLVC